MSRALFFFIIIPVTAVVAAAFLFVFRFITNQKRIMPQREVRFFYDDKIKKIALINFKYTHKIHFAFFNYTEFKKFIFPKKIEFFVRFLKTFSVKYQNTNQLVNFFVLTHKTNFSKTPAHFVLPQKTNLHNKVTATEVHVGYIPDSEGNFTIFFELKEKRIFDVLIKNKRTTPDFLARHAQGNGTFFIVSLESQLEHDAEEAALIFIKKLHHNNTKTSNYKWLIFEKLLVIFVSKNKTKHFKKHLLIIAKKYFIGKIFAFHAASFQQLEISFSRFLFFLNNTPLPPPYVNLEENKELVQDIKKNIDVHKYWTNFFLKEKEKSWVVQKFFDGDIVVNYISPLFFARSAKKMSDFIKERVIDAFYDVFLSDGGQLNETTPLVELTFNKFIEVMSLIQDDSLTIKPFLVVNSSTNINYFSLKQALTKQPHLDYSLKINSILNQDFYKALPLLRPKYVLVSSEISKNLDRHAVWAQFQTIFTVLKAKKSKFIFEGMVIKLEKNKTMMLKPFETIETF